MPATPMFPLPSSRASHFTTIAGCVLSVALIALLGGCGIREHRDAAQLRGVWQLDPEAGLEMRIGTAPDPQSAPDSFQLTTGSARTESDPGASPAGDSVMTLSFLAGGKLETQTTTGEINTRKSGSWRMMSYDGQQRTAVISCTLGQQTSEHEVQWIAADTIKLTPPNMAGLSIKLVFRRAAPGDQSADD
jgi:hypothetical protein